jgi:hypothetical protein
MPLWYLVCCTRVNGEKGNTMLMCCTVLMKRSEKRACAAYFLRPKKLDVFEIIRQSIREAK